jgi:hypothetical protein
MSATAIQTASERIRRLRYEALIAQFEAEGWPIAIVRAIEAAPDVPVSRIVVEHRL